MKIPKRKSKRSRKTQRQLRGRRTNRNSRKHISKRYSRRLKKTIKKKSNTRIRRLRRTFKKRNISQQGGVLSRNINKSRNINIPKKSNRKILINDVVYFRNFTNHVNLCYANSSVQIFLSSNFLRHIIKNKEKFDYKKDKEFFNLIISLDKEINKNIDSIEPTTTNEIEKSTLNEFKEYKYINENWNTLFSQYYDKSSDKNKWNWEYYYNSIFKSKTHQGNQGVPSEFIDNTLRYISFLNLYISIPNTIQKINKTIKNYKFERINKEEFQKNIKYIPYKNPEESKAEFIEIAKEKIKTFFTSKNLREFKFILKLDYPENYYYEYKNSTFTEIEKNNDFKYFIFMNPLPNFFKLHEFELYIYELSILNRQTIDENIESNSLFGFYYNTQLFDKLTKEEKNLEEFNRQQVSCNSCKEILDIEINENDKFRKNLFYYCGLTSTNVISVDKFNNSELIEEEIEKNFLFEDKLEILYDKPLNKEYYLYYRKEPPIIFIQLQRGNDDRYYDIEVKLKEEYTMNSKKYVLKGFNQSGIGGGHYWSYVSLFYRDNDNNYKKKWCYLNDICDIEMKDNLSDYQKDYLYKTWTIALYEREDLIEFSDNVQENINEEIKKLQKNPKNCRGQK